ncbi:hypothetical protein Droror1_Dr00003135 [Drosera rotundifolia]
MKQRKSLLNAFSAKCHDKDHMLFFPWQPEGISPAFHPKKLTILTDLYDTKAIVTDKRSTMSLYIFFISDHGGALGWMTIEERICTCGWGKYGRYNFTKR